MKNYCVIKTIISLFLVGFALPLKASETRDVRVLSYNINGLPAPLQTGREPYFERIAELLRERRRAGTQPDIVLIQEAFDNHTRVIAEKTGYPYVLRGPDRRDTSKRGDVHWAMKARKTYSSFTDPQKFMGSGLLILSDFPIIEARHKAFNSDECAGIDCLSNKAILLARVQVPGMATPLDIITTHFNSLNSAKAPSRIAFKAHKKQTDVFEWFLGQVNSGNPIIIGGDFNTKARKRYDYFQATVELDDVAEVCLQEVQDCRLHTGVTPASVWHDTNDKQFYRGSKTVTIFPLSIDRPFDEKLQGKPLSDHTGYEVIYRLSQTEKHVAVKGMK
ncbi:endonuclease/exonuclease/phosphatase family protein [Kordiimonas pumila]|uniref:Endonuclease/exonuclease/phosphatase family protein n=1 Tax=Kordiimonas pumila TaxID=2161677 RepID=A0ABV7D2B1_9PROT|nr:endonuclease/exonuclease/phosphatase family protein [Kordiimonas pumila]